MYVVIVYIIFTIRKDDIFGRQIVIKNIKLKATQIVARQNVEYDVKVILFFILTKDGNFNL